MSKRLGVDVGGTFVDATLVDDATGQIQIWKTPSTPDRPEVAVLGAVSGAIERADGDTLDIFVHGSTVATNAFLERKGARVGILTTKGFGDVLAIGRQVRRERIYDWYFDRPEPVAAAAMIREVRERILADGSIHLPLDDDDVADATRRLLDDGAEAIAICFLNSYRNSCHEQSAAAIAKCIANGNVPVITSSDTSPEFREYERFSTAAAAAFVTPVAAGYLGRLSDAISHEGVEVAPLVMMSTGGIVDVASAGANAAQMLLSGPAGGVVAGTHFALRAGHASCINFDMGGTSCDISLVHEGQAAISTEMLIDGHPIRVPMIGIHTIGAGGGSIAHVDAGGILGVGPESAGAVPGPVCYGRGGTRPTVSDANAVLGLLSPDRFLGGRMEVDLEGARKAIGEVGAAVGLDLEAAASGIFTVVNANMIDATRAVSVQRGFDPRDFVLVAFGGCGPIHASYVARELGVPRVIVPYLASLLSAYGMLLSDLRAERVRTVLSPLEAGSADRIAETFRELASEARKELVDMGAVDRLVALRYVADMRYLGQSYEVQVPVDLGYLSPDRISSVRTAFEAEHGRAYGHADPHEPVEWVNLRAVALAPPLPGSVSDGASAAWPCSAAPEPGYRPVYMPEVGARLSTAVWRGEDLPAGFEIDGPALVEYDNHVAVVPDFARARVDGWRSLLIEVAS